MKKQLFFLFALLSLARISYAYDYFTAVCSSGQTLAYYTISGTEVSVGTVDDISGNLVIPSSVTYGGQTYSVTSIEEYAFQNCSNLTSVTIPNSVTSIGGYAFKGCSGLTTLNFNADSCGGNGLSIDYYDGEYYSYHWLSGCTSLTTVNIGNNVRVIPDYFVSGCTGLTSITIPNSVTSIGEAAFYSCTGLTTLNYNADSCTSMGSYGLYGWLSFCTALTTLNIGNNVRIIPNSAFSGCSGLTSVTIPNSVTSIGGYAFSGCTGLTSVIIGNSVTSIGNNAFEYCSGLTSVTIPNSVTSIGVNAFQNCSGLTSVTIPNSVTSIGNRAFMNCTGLISVTIGNSVTNIGNAAFSNCTGLTSVTIPNSVTSIGGSAFENCSGLTSITIPNSVTSIGNAAFSNCTGLTSVTIPNSVDSIHNGAFSGCTSMRVLDLGSGVNSIGASAFFNCNRLDTIYSRNPTPATVADVNAFENVWKGLPLIVPTGSRNAYAIAYAWREFTNIQEGTLPQGIEDAVYDGVVMKSVDGQIVINGADGHRVTLTNIQGRTLYRNTATGTITVDVPASGIYLLQLDDFPAKRISVVR